MERQFQVLTLGRAFLNEVGVGDALLDGRNEAQSFLRCPFASPTRSSAGHAFATFARNCCSAPGAGSHATTSSPCANARDTQPLPMTPTPTQQTS